MHRLQCHDWRDYTKNDMFHTLYGIGHKEALDVYEVIKSEVVKDAMV
jgi:hypothetical protein